MSGESPIAWPPAHYLGGFLRPYFQAEAIASGVLQQAQGGLEEGLLCGSVMALRHPSDLPLARAGAARGDSALEASVALLLPGADAGNPCVVAPPAKINVGSAARALLEQRQGASALGRINARAQGGGVGPHTSTMAKICGLWSAGGADAGPPGKFCMKPPKSPVKCW